MWRKSNKRTGFWKTKAGDYTCIFEVVEMQEIGRHKCEEISRIDLTVVTYRYFNSITMRTSIKLGLGTSRHEKVTEIKTPC